MAATGAVKGAQLYGPASSPDFLELNLASSVVLASGAASAATGSALPAGPYTLIATADAWVTFGASPTAVAATVGNIFLAKGQPMKLNLGSGLKAAAIQDAAAGNVMIYPVAVSA